MLMAFCSIWLNTIISFGYLPTLHHLKLSAFLISYLSCFILMNLFPTSFLKCSKCFLSSRNLQSFPILEVEFHLMKWQHEELMVVHIIVRMLFVLLISYFQLHIVDSKWSINLFIAQIVELWLEGEQYVLVCFQSQSLHLSLPKQHRVSHSFTCLALELNSKEFLFQSRWFYYRLEPFPWISRHLWLYC